eukprot:gene1328-15_t
MYSILHRMYSNGHESTWSLHTGAAGKCCHVLLRGDVGLSYWVLADAEEESYLPACLPACLTACLPGEAQSLLSCWSRKVVTAAIAVVIEVEVLAGFLEYLLLAVVLVTPAF